MGKHRIYGENVQINTELVKNFYNDRAALVNGRGWEVITLGDEDPTIASRVYDYDRNTLLPKLNITPTTRVLELGCGMGRWAEILLPHCGFYCGVDFSEKMLREAERICKDFSDRSSFFHMSVPEAVERDPHFYGGKFNCFIFSGVCIYINDVELKRVFEKIPDLCQERCVICVKETAAIEERLTLNEFPSEALRSNYSAIYRTPEEYRALFRPLLQAGFSISNQYFLPAEVGRKRQETNGWCTILRK